VSSNTNISLANERNALSSSLRMLSRAFFAKP
jgi:hypothetical protein